MAERFVYQAVINKEMEIDDQGRIWRIGRRSGTKAGATISTPVPRRRAERHLGPYLNVRAMIDQKRMTALAHRMVWHHINGPIPEGMTINHKNGIKDDNHPSNLELATDSEQQIHANQILGTGSGANQWGEKNSQAKLTLLQVQEIKKLYQSGRRATDLATAFHVTFQQIYRVINGSSRSNG
jgi:hypothetical protein